MRGGLSVLRILHRYPYQDVYICSTIPWARGHDKLWVPRVPRRFCIKSPSECVCVWVGGGSVLWVPRVPTSFCIRSLYICSTLAGTNGYQVSRCVYRAMTIYGYHGYQRVFVLNLRLSVCVCGWGGCIMGTTGTNAFLYEISIYLQYSHGYQWVPVYNGYHGYHGYQRVFV